jgi:hypothetical protein
MTVIGETNGKSSKKPYVKPALTEIKLVAGETVLAGCKINNTAGPGYAAWAKCRNVISGVTCQVITNS